MIQQWTSIEQENLASIPCVSRTSLLTFQRLVILKFTRTPLQITTTFSELLIEFHQETGLSQQSSPALQIQRPRNNMARTVSMMPLIDDCWPVGQGESDLCVFRFLICANLLQSLRPPCRTTSLRWNTGSLCLCSTLDLAYGRYVHQCLRQCFL